MWADRLSRGKTPDTQTFVVSSKIRRVREEWGSCRVWPGTTEDDPIRVMRRVWRGWREEMRGGNVLILPMLTDMEECVKEAERMVREQKGGWVAVLVPENVESMQEKHWWKCLRALATIVALETEVWVHAIAGRRWSDEGPGPGVFRPVWGRERWQAWISSSDTKGV